MKVKFSLVTLLMALVLTGCVGPEPQTVEPKIIRVMTYNIHHAEGADGKVDTQRIADLIIHEKADIVGLQEVDRGVQRTARRDLIAEIAAKTGMNFYFGKNIDFNGGDYGNAVLTRFPIRSSSNKHFRMLRPHEQRGVQSVVCDVGGRDLVFLNTHMDYRPNDSERRNNVSELRQLVGRRQNRPLILSGDFNSEPDSEIYSEMHSFLRDSWAEAGQGNGYTFSSSERIKRIDYIWFNGGGRLTALKSWIPDTLASDHLPLVTEFRLE